MKVTVMVVTYNRERFMPAIYYAYQRQTYSDTELLVMDDSKRPSAFFQQLKDPRVRYIHLPKRLSIGTKRNRLVELATGEWICHFDDDDYYADNYIERMLDYSSGVDFVKLTGWYNFSLKPRILTYTDTRRLDSFRFEQTGKGLQALRPRQMDCGPFQRKWVLGYGFSYFYRRQVALRFPFKEVNYGEDYPMVNAFVNAGGRINLVRDEVGLVLHQLHASNTSTVSPQYRMPNFLLARVFPGYARYTKKFFTRSSTGMKMPTTSVYAPKKYWQHYVSSVLQ